MLTPAEARLLTQKEAQAGYRLACQTKLHKNSVVIVPEESRSGRRKFKADGLERPVDLNPLVKKLHLILSETLLKSHETYADKILKAAEEANLKGLKFSLWAMRQMPKVLGRPCSDVTLTILDDGSIISVEDGDTSGRLYGVALDVGTSKIVGHLVSLADGRTLAVASVENPQAVHGEDVMSRITFALGDPGNLDELRRLLLEAVNQVLEMLCAGADVNRRDVYEAVVVGNTLMHHLFLELEPSSLARAPFNPVVRKGISAAAQDLSIAIHPAGVVYLPALVAGFVGSDAVADLLATQIYDSGEPALLVDIGTNTEIFVGDHRGVVACSCASGPAFEGAHISHGMKAVSGAIERLRIDPETFEVEYETINGTNPIGLCGSAMVDALAEMWKCGLVDGLGRFNLDAGTPRMRASADGGEFVMVWGDATGTGRDITLTQRDIETIILAKAAIYAACSVMLRRRGLEAEELTRVYVAGAFGSYLDAENAAVIGMLPDLPAERVMFVGNTAVTGAKMILLSKEARRTAEALPDRVRYHELSLDPEFNREFLNALFIPHKEPERFQTARRLAHRRGR